MCAAGRRVDCGAGSFHWAQPAAVPAGQPWMAAGRCPCRFDTGQPLQPIPKCLFFLAFFLQVSAEEAVAKWEKQGDIQ